MRNAVLDSMLESVLCRKRWRKGECEWMREVFKLGRRPLVVKAGEQLQSIGVASQLTTAAAASPSGLAMALPRLKPNAELPPPKKSARISFKSNSRSTPAKNQETSGKIATASSQDDENQDAQQHLAREEEILSLLTALNAPVMNAELPATLQAVKAHLYARNYSAAFGQPVSSRLAVLWSITHPHTTLLQYRTTFGPTLRDGSLAEHWRIEASS
jgi:hypothetical protein